MESFKFIFCLSVVLSSIQQFESIAILENRKLIQEEPQLLCHAIHGLQTLCKEKTGEKNCLSELTKAMQIAKTMEIHCDVLIEHSTSGKMNVKMSSSLDTNDQENGSIKWVCIAIGLIVLISLSGLILICFLKCKRSTHSETDTMMMMMINT